MVFLNVRMQEAQSLATPQMDWQRRAPAAPWGRFIDEGKHGKAMDWFAIKIHNGIFECADAGSAVACDSADGLAATGASCTLGQVH